MNALLVLGFALPGALAAWVFTAYGHGYLGGILTLLGVVAAGATSFLFIAILEARR